VITVMGVSVGELTLSSPAPSLPASPLSCHRILFSASGERSNESPICWKMIFIKEHLLAKSICFAHISSFSSSFARPTASGHRGEFHLKYLLPTPTPTGRVWRNTTLEGEKVPADNCSRILHQETKFQAQVCSHVQIFLLH